MRHLFAVAALAGAAACGVDSCIARGAWVRTPRGLRPIEEVDVGDEVLCLDPADGTLQRATVLAIKRAHRECIRLTFEGGELVLTSDHPVFCPDACTWAPAGDWALGKRTRLLRTDGEQAAPVTVREVASFAGIFDVFDLTVDHPLHNFLANGVLVHNKSPPQPTCTAPDGGTVFELDPCTCPSGARGHILCPGPDGQAVCSDCGDAGAPGPDGGG